MISYDLPMIFPWPLNNESLRQELHLCVVQQRHGLRLGRQPGRGQRGRRGITCRSGGQMWKCGQSFVIFCYYQLI